MKAGSTAAQNFLYEEVAGRIANQIERGALKPGERVPSVRSLRTKFGVSLSTALRAYLSLEDRGLIEARPQSGYYVRLHSRQMPPVPVMSIPSSTASTVDIGRLALEVHENILDPRVVPLGGATPGISLLPTKQLNKILTSLARRFEERSGRYEATSGNIDLRHQIARRSIDAGCNLTQDEIVITTGGTEALNLCLRAITKPGDTVAIESPTYFGILQILESLDLKAVEVPTDPDVGLSVHALESILRKHRVSAVLVQPNFHNPLGCLMSEQNKRTLVELLAHRHIPVVEDDVYGDLPFEGNRPKLLKTFDKDGTVLTCSSFSKTVSPGFRVGWCAPGKFLDMVRLLKLTSSLSSATLPQMALAEMLANRGYDKILRGVRRSYKLQMQLMTDAASRYFPEGTKVTRPTGGMVLWVEFPRGVDAMELYRRALNKDVSVLPGPLFSPKGQYKRHIRLNCGHPWSERIDEAMITIGRIAARMTTRIDG
jgi:DNA-binding transcriptional MocR family regulator